MDNLFSMFHSISFMVQLILAISITFSMLSMPFLFTFYIIPKIEKRLGKKLEFVMLSYYFYGMKFAGSFYEISWCVVKKYLMWKSNKPNFNEVKPKSKWALWRAPYRIEEASKFEIFISFFVSINTILFFIIGGILWIQSKLNGS